MGNLASACKCRWIMWYGILRTLLSLGSFISFLRRQCGLVVAVMVEGTVVSRLVSDTVDSVPLGSLLLA